MSAEANRPEFLLSALYRSKNQCTTEYIFHQINTDVINSSFISTISTSLWVAKNVTGFSETLSQKIMKFSENSLSLTEKFVKGKEIVFLFCKIFLIYLKNTENIYASSWCRDSFGVILVKIFQKLEFRTKFLEIS